MIPPLNVEAWLDALPEALVAHGSTLRSALGEVEGDPRLIALQVQGSIGRGTGDRHSDLDLGLVVSEAAWPAIVDEIPNFVRRLGDVIDEHYQFVPSAAAPEMYRAWAQYENGVQLDLMVLPSTRLLVGRSMTLAASYW